MNISVFWIVGLSIGNLIGGIINTNAESIQFINTVCILLTAIYLIQQESDKNKSEIKDVNERS